MSKVLKERAGLSVLLRLARQGEVVVQACKEEVPAVGSRKMLSREWTSGLVNMPTVP